MGGLNVKNTIFERGLEIIAPHLCFGCGKMGSVLCPDCKYDITFEGFSKCILCGASNRGRVCDSHNAPFDTVFVVGDRVGPLKSCIDAFKFRNAKSVHATLATLLDETLPFLPKDVTVVPIPTVRSHIRWRGYDQTALTARSFAHLRGNRYEALLERVNSFTQHVSDKAQRRAQSKSAFAVKYSSSLAGRRVLLIDDIVTTGSTLLAAAHALRGAGATVWVAALAYQPLD